MGKTKGKGGKGEKSVKSGGGLEQMLALQITSTVVLSEKTLKFKEVLTLRPGDILEFSKGVNEPLDLEVGASMVARGVAVKMGEKFGLQIAEICDPRERVRALGA